MNLTLYIYLYFLGLTNAVQEGEVDNVLEADLMVADTGLLMLLIIILDGLGLDLTESTATEVDHTAGTTLATGT